MTDDLRTGMARARDDAWACFTPPGFNHAFSEVKPFFYAGFDAAIAHYTAHLGDALWDALRKECCADPENATKCVMVGKEQLARAGIAAQVAAIKGDGA